MQQNKLLVREIKTRGATRTQSQIVNFVNKDLLFLCLDDNSQFSIRRQANMF